MLWEASGLFVEVVLLVALRSLASAERKVFVNSGWRS